MPNSRRIFYCRYCQNLTYKCESTSAACYYLQHCHGIEIEVEDVQIKKRRNQRLEDAFQKAGEVSAMKLKKQHEEVLRKVLNQKVINEALVQLIAVRNLPYNCMTWPELHALLMTVNYMVEDVLRSSAAEVPKLMKSSYMTHKNILQKKLQSAISKIHLTADVWTSPNRKSFLGICAHFVDGETKKLCQALLALPELEEGHGGEQQAGVLLRVLEDYGIVDKIGYVTGDNHGSNDKLCRFISKHLSDQGINWSSVHHRIRCHGHVVNLAIQAFLFSKDHDVIDVMCQQVEAKDG